MGDADLEVFVFAPAWGLPSSGPFACKLLAWLRLHGIAHQVVVEDDSRKGPKGKNPWVRLDGELLGDSELVIEALAARHGIELGVGLDARSRGLALGLRRLAEEHLHQVFEHELIVHDTGYRAFRAMVCADLPPVVGPLVASWLRSHFRRQLHARGVGRHAPDVIERMGRADLDALADVLGDRPWFFGDTPTDVDCAIWGQVAPFVFSGLGTPVAEYARTHPTLGPWAGRARALWFPELVTTSIAA